MAQAVTADPPLIMLSYHADDDNWRARLVSHLGPAAAKYGLWDNRLIESTHGRVDEQTRVVLERAKVLIVLFSPAYIGLTWITSEEGFRWLEYLTGKGLHIFSTTLQQTSFQPFPTWRSLNVMQINVTPMAEKTPAEQDRRFASLAQEIVRVLETESASINSEEQPIQPTVTHLDRFQMSTEVQNALYRARRLATTAMMTPSTVTTPCLLFGLAEGGRKETDYYKTPQFLWNQLTARGDGAYARALTEEFPRLGERAGLDVDSIQGVANLVTVNVVKVFELAESLVHRTVYVGNVSEGMLPPQIGARHLLAALLVFDPKDDPSGATRRLALLAQVDLLRKQFYYFIVNSVPFDDREAWQSILGSPARDEPKDRDHSPIHSADTFTQPTVAGFMADEWHGRDLLGIEHDVNALASLVAAYKVEPPLSIGLFGDWGSGKSHFMRQMRKRVELLSKRSRDSGKPQNELGYYKNIVQIEFNAWHYIEGNLWASLVDHIFANLRLSEDEPRTLAEQRRDELIQKLGVKEEIQNKINSEVQECEDELRKLTERKERAETELQQASTQLKGFREEVKASLKTLSVQVNFTEEEKKLLSRLGIQTGTKLSSADVHRNYLQLKDRWTSLKAKWKLFRSDGRVVRRYVLSTLLVVIAIGAPALLKLSEVPRLPTVVVSVLGFVATLLAAAKPAWDQFQKSLNALEKYDLELERERQKRITELENEVSALTKEVVAAKLESETVGEEISKLKADIKSTNTSRILAEFIEDRAAATDYRRHLGLLALIRRDFEKMRELFQEQRKETNEGKSGEYAQADLKRIDRIVLYIDDLDRCPPKRVVQVLQAIHLLLAFPLFVVVVGVDSRWITRSLQQSYEWLQEADEIIANDGAEPQEGDPLTGSGATPHDYLEKIFQIPFWLRPMNDDACIEFLDGLTNDAVVTEAAINARHGDGVTAGSVQADWASEIIDAPHHGSRALVPAPAPPLPTSNDLEVGFTPDIQWSPGSRLEGIRVGDMEKLDLTPLSLTFSSHEVEYMKKLVPLIGRSPRAVKRFLNCYRLIKVGLGPAEFENFVGQNGDALPYKAAMILLGVITGTPTVSAHVIEQLKAWRREFNFESFSGALLPNSEMRQKPDGDRLVRFLDSHDFGTTALAISLFEEMRNCAPRISRFSFRVNRSDAAR